MQHAEFVPNLYYVQILYNIHITFSLIFLMCCLGSTILSFVINTSIYIRANLTANTVRLIYYTFMITYILPTYDEHTAEVYKTHNKSQ